MFAIKGFTKILLMILIVIFELYPIFLKNDFEVLWIRLCAKAH